MNRSAARGTLALPLALLAACNLYPYEAERSEDVRAEAHGLTSIECTIHNGSIHVEGLPGTSEVAVAARIVASGSSPASAEANVERLGVALEREGDRLLVRCQEAEDGWETIRGTYYLRISAPPEVAQQLASHNGIIEVEAMAGCPSVTSHNGPIRVRTSAAEVHAETHNGPVAVELLGAGPVQGEIRSHNGPVTVTLGDRCAVVAAHSHNGGVRVEGAFATREHDDGSVELVAGDRGGALAVATHNGPVTIR